MKTAQTLKPLIRKHLDRIRSDFNIPENIGIAKNSEFRSYTWHEVIELPVALDGSVQPYVTISMDVDDKGLWVEHRLKVYTESGENYDLILKTRKYSLEA